jgi:hypothetical protein
MKKLKITAGIIWAVICLVIIIILFPGLQGFSRSLASLPFMKIHPRYTGGEPLYREINQNCTLVVRKPVFAGLIRERDNGFVQIDWRGNLSEHLSDTIDTDMDGNPDFIIRVDTRNSETSMISLNKKIGDVNVSTPVSYGWAVRVNLNK